MCVTVLASQPSVSMATDTTQRMCSPRRPGLPTVFITSRRMSSSVISSVLRPGKRCTYSCLKRSISAWAALRNAGSSASPRSSWAESTSRVLGRSRNRPSCSLEKSGRLPGTTVVEPSGSVFCQPAIQSETSLEVAVLEQTTMKTGGVPMPASAQASKPRR